MTIRFTVTARLPDGVNYVGTITFADLVQANNAAFVTIRRENGTLVSVNVSRLEALEIEATDEELQAAKDEFEAEIRARQQAQIKAVDPDAEATRDYVAEVS